MKPEVPPFDLIRESGATPEPLPGTVRFAAVQFDPKIGEPERNLERCLQAMNAARGEGATLVAFPECALTGYCFADREEALDNTLPQDHPVFGRLSEAAGDLGLTAIVGYLERVQNGIANAASVVSGSGIEGHYRKTHLPFLGVDRWVQRGCSPFRIHETAGIRVGILICFDASFPEAARSLTLAGADLLVLPTNWPEEAEAKAEWLPNTRAYENVVYFAAVNRVGEERGYVFHGRSRICGPTGETLVQGPPDREAICLVDVDPVRARTKKIVRREGEYWVDRIGERRIDLYDLSPPAQND